MSRATAGPPPPARRLLLWTLLLFPPLLAACAPGRAPPGPELPRVERFVGTDEAPLAWPEAGWWRGFGAAELDRLVAEALAGNADLRVALARIEQADAQVRIAGAALLPTFQAGAGAGVTRSGFGRAFGGDAGTRESYDAGLSAAWEVDLWGANRAGLGAAESLAVAGRFAHDAVALSVAAGVAETYFRLLALRDRLRIARANLDNARRVLALVEVRVANGIAAPLELAQQRTQVASQQASLPALEQQERLTLQALALLLGRPLDGFAVTADSLGAIDPVPVVAGLPSELLRRRPDLRAAEARLVAAAADVAAARAALYPSIGLTARAGLESDALRDLLSAGHLLGIAASLVAPIFDAGRLRGRVALGEAQQLELVEAYRGTVLAAFADVEDALAAARLTREREAALATAAAEARRAFALAEARFREGAIGLIELLDAQRTLFSSEDALAAARLDRLASLVALYRALGGGWSGYEALTA
ncbi:MAG TPA: efflux transporter outer membrane subunit [Geminicoccaceae bacterium]|nr:efflux transporter outer membrane subunit [Geminicoccaceae bacterium]